MASAYLLSAYDPEVSKLNTMAEAARRGPGAHTLVDDPDSADLIVFVEARPGWPFYEDVLRHPLRRRYPDRCFLFTRVDDPVPVLPGVYASIPARADVSGWTRAGTYLSAARWQEPAAPPEDPLLFSFIGNAANHPVRERLLALDGPESVVEDTSVYWPYGDLAPEERARLDARYVEVGLRSRFILAPRGKGVSSIRLFEALRMGRAPVIIADDWSEPEGPDWDAISVRVAEKDVGHIPDLLRERVTEAEAMGRRGREVWERWFSDRAIFDSVVTWCLAIRAERRLAPPALRLLACTRAFRLAHAKSLARKVVPLRN